jgi:hypothetical protein
LRRAATVYRLDDDAERTIAMADPPRLLEGERPILIDEWQDCRKRLTAYAERSMTAPRRETFC